MISCSSKIKNIIHSSTTKAYHPTILSVVIPPPAYVFSLFRRFLRQLGRHLLPQPVMLHYCFASNCNKPRRLHTDHHLRPPTDHNAFLPTLDSWTRLFSPLYVCVSYSIYHNATIGRTLHEQKHTQTQTNVDLSYKQSALVLYVIAFIYGCLLAAIRSEWLRYISSKWRARIGCVICCWGVGAWLAPRDWI